MGGWAGERPLTVESVGFYSAGGVASGGSECFWRGVELCACGAGLCSACRFPYTSAFPHEALPCHSPTVLFFPSRTATP